MENLILNNVNKVEIAESNDTYLLAKFIVCDFSENRNGVKLNRETVESWYKSLIDMPLVGKVKDGDFGSHEATKVFSINNEGNIVQKYNFNTDAFGVFIDVNIETIDDKEMIVGQAKIWKRFNCCCDVLKNKIDNNEPIGTSWEISISEESKENNTRVINNGKFLSLCLLGSQVTPAYESNDSSLLEVASKDNTIDEFEQAFVEDLKNINKDFNAEISAKNNINNNLENEGGHKDMADENKKNIELSALTSRDLRDKVRSAVYSTEGNGRWYYDILIYPYDYTAYAKIEGKDFCDEDFCKFTYVVNSDNTISLTNQEDVKMVFIPKDENNTAVAELQTSLSEKEAELSNKLNDIVKLGETIKELQTSISEKETIISELSPIKEKYDQEQIEKAELEKQTKMETLKSEALSSQYVTEEDFETSEVLKTALSELDEKVIKTFIADRVIEQASKQKKEPKEEVSEKQTNNIETSSVDLSSTQEYSYTDDLKNDSFYKILHGYR